MANEQASNNLDNNVEDSHSDTNIPIPLTPETNGIDTEAAEYEHDGWTLWSGGVNVHITVNPDMANGNGEEDTDGSSSDSSQTAPPEGYEMLPTNDCGPNAVGAFSDEEVSSPQLPNPDLPPIVPISTELVGEVWNASSNPPSAVSLTTNEIDAVKSAMQSVQISPNCIPPWASEISEDDWKSHLLDIVRRNRSHNRRLTPSQRVETDVANATSASNTFGDVDDDCER